MASVLHCEGSSLGNYDLSWHFSHHFSNNLTHFVNFSHQHSLEFKGGRTTSVKKTHSLNRVLLILLQPDVSERTKRSCSSNINLLLFDSLPHLVSLTHTLTPPTQTTQLASGPSGQALTATSRTCTSCPSWWLTAGPPPSAPREPWPFMSAAVTQVSAAAGAAPLLTLSSLSPSASAAATLKGHLHAIVLVSKQLLSAYICGRQNNTRQQICRQTVDNCASAGWKSNVCMV